MHDRKVNATMKVLLIIGMQMVREKLRQLLEHQPEVEIVEEAGDASIGLQAIEDFDPDVAVIDIETPLRFGIEAVRRMLLQKPTLKIIALSMYSDRRYLDACLQAGACGYLLKDCAYEELMDAVRSVTSDRQYLSRSIRLRYV
jgi:DNA-binding NarL/FixJ family response regulator